MITSRTHPVEFNAVAVDVWFDEDAMHVVLADGRQISLPLAYSNRLFDATPAQRRNWELVGGGYGIHWEELDEDISVKGLMRLH